MSRRIDLNVDIAEGFPFDKDLLKIATSANICCGVHAGDESLTFETIDYCRSHRIRFGAHPGYPDRQTMGRNPIESGTQKQYLDSIFSQLSRFAQYAKPQYVKPHGAFYNDTAVPLPEGWDVDEEGKVGYQAGGIFLSRYTGVQSPSMVLRVYKVPLMGLHGTAHEAVAYRTHFGLIREGFADRGYKKDGTLVPRTEPGAVLQEPTQIREQVLRLVSNVDSICLHGDTPGCLEFADLVRKTLVDAGYEVGC